MHLFQINQDIKNEFNLQLVGLPNEEAIKFSTRGYIGNGQQWDKLLSDFIKNPNTKEVTEEVTVVKELIARVKEIHNGLEFVDSKFPLFGFMRDRESDERKMPKSYLWQGEADAIALYEGKYTIVDFKVVSDLADYKKTAYDLYGKHLHQCLVYARLLQLHMGLDYLPPVLIVVINKPTGCDLYLPFFKEYPLNCKDRIKRFEWSVTQFPEKPPLNIDKNENLFQNSDFEGTVSSDQLLNALFKSEAKVKDLLDAIDRGSLNIKAPE